MYECKVCRVKTSNKYDFNKHLNTNKHKKLSESYTVCKLCFKEFTNKYTTARHEKQCALKKSNNIENKSTNSGSGLSASIVGDNNVINNSPVIVTMNISKEKSISLETIKISDIQKKTTDKLDKMILECMIDSDKDINSFVERFDRDIECYMYKLDENNKIPVPVVLSCVKYAIMNLEDDIVMYHKIRNLSGKKVFMFKTGEAMCYKESLEIFFSKSKYKDNIDIDECIKLVEVDSRFTTGYAEYYKDLRFKAKKIIKENR